MFLNSEDGKLIVCVCLCGKVYNCQDRRDGGQLEPGYDSHVAEEGEEWVLFESSQGCTFSFLNH